VIVIAILRYYDCDHDWREYLGKRKRKNIEKGKGGKRKKGIGMGMTDG
jgi:hypothetical protein